MGPGSQLTLARDDETRGWCEGGSYRVRQNRRGFSRGRSGLLDPGLQLRRNRDDTLCVEFAPACSRNRSGSQWAPARASLGRGDGREDVGCCHSHRPSSRLLFLGGHPGCSSSEVIPAAGEAGEPEPIGTLSGSDTEDGGSVAHALQPLPPSSRTRLKAEDPGPESHRGCGVVPEYLRKALGSPVPGRAALARDDETRGWCEGGSYRLSGVLDPGLRLRRNRDDTRCVEFARACLRRRSGSQWVPGRSSRLPGVTAERMRPRRRGGLQVTGGVTAEGM